MSRTRAFTLIEMLVACALLMIILGLIFQVVVPMARGTVRGSQQVELQQIATVALTRVCEEMEHAPFAGVKIQFPPGPNDKLIWSIHKIVDVDSSGEQVWSGVATYYWYAPVERKLWRKTFPPGPPGAQLPATDAGYQPSPAEMQAIVADRNGTERPVATSVREFQITPAGNTFRFRMLLQLAPPDPGPPESFELSRSVYLRNERL